MAIRIVRLGTARRPGEGLRIGTVRHPPRGVPKSQHSAQNWYDVWFPVLAPSVDTMKLAQAAGKWSLKPAWTYGDIDQGDEAVYANGVRLNQPFGDTLNWDLVPEIAGEQVTLDLTRPAAEPGQTVTLDAVDLAVSPGLRATDTRASLSLRSSLGGSHAVERH